MLLEEWDDGAEGGLNSRGWGGVCNSISAHPGPDVRPGSSPVKQDLETTRCDYNEPGGRRGEIKSLCNGTVSWRGGG